LLNKFLITHNFKYLIVKKEKKSEKLCLLKNSERIKEKIWINYSQINKINDSFIEILKKYIKFSILTLKL
jgi:hypothetical protein